MNVEERIELARRTHREAWCSEPITRIPVDEQKARNAAAAAAYNDSKQDQTRMLT